MYAASSGWLCKIYRYLTILLEFYVTRKTLAIMKTHQLSLRQKLNTLMPPFNHLLVLDFFVQSTFTRIN